MQKEETALELLRSLLSELDVFYVWTVSGLCECVQHDNPARFLHRVHTPVSRTSVYFQLNDSIPQIVEQDGWSEAECKPAFELRNECDDDFSRRDFVKVFLCSFRENSTVLIRVSSCFRMVLRDLSIGFVVAFNFMRTPFVKTPRNFGALDSNSIQILIYLRIEKFSSKTTFV